MKFLLDTNLCIGYINGRVPKIRQRLSSIPDTDIAINAITQSEMYAGSAKSKTPELSRTKQDAFFIRFVSLSFDELAAHEFGLIRAHLERLGTPIGPYDMQIASIAVAHHLILITHNTKEFNRIPWLKIEDWEA